ncbi:MAG: hypothetical protein NTY39_02080 [Campylobacterales bacterium]|nr:hypothetical protein [Campylobacterales bacterium]
MTLIDRKKYFNLCDPFVYSDPDGLENVNLDEMGVRGRDWSDVLSAGIELSDTPICELFTGHRGSGKTTELKKVQRRLEAESGANLLTVYINAEEYVDTSNEIDVTDILSIIVHSTIKEVAVFLDKDPNEVLHDGYFQRLWNWLVTTDVAFKEAEFNVTDSAKLVFEMKTRPSLRQKIRESIASNFSTFVKDIRDELMAQQGKVLPKKAGLLIIFDQLEKLRGLSSNWGDVLKSAEKVFGGDGQYIKLPVHVIYTLPPALATKMHHINFLPVIKIKTKEGNLNPKGIEAMRDMALRRIPEASMYELLGENWRERLDEIIIHSGGFPRDLMLMLRSALRASSFPISQEAFENIFNDSLNEFKQLIMREDFEWLAKVAKNKVLTLDSDAHSASADRMLSIHAVFQYLNGELWYDVHPAVAKILESDMADVPL